MATGTNYWIQAPTPGQSPIVFKGIPFIDANAIQPYLRAGWVGSDKTSSNRQAKYFKLLVFSCNFTASALAANRTIQVRIGKYPPREESPYIQIGGYVTGNIAASETARVTLSPVGALTNLTLTDTLTLYATAEFRPGSIILAGNDFITVQIANVQAGDILNFAAEFEYLNNQLGINQA